MTVGVYKTSLEYLITPESKEAITNQIMSKELETNWKRLPMVKHVIISASLMIIKAMDLHLK